MNAGFQPGTVDRRDQVQKIKTLLWSDLNAGVLYTEKQTSRDVVMTELIARIAGPYLLLTGIGFVISRGFYERMVRGNANADPILLNLSGAAHFIVGMILLTHHFRWSNLPEIAVSLLGLAAIAKGASLIVIPEKTLQAPKTVGKTLGVSAAGFLIAGAYISYVGYLGVIIS